MKLLEKRKKTVRVGEEYILNEKSSFLIKEDYKALRSNIDFLFSDTASNVIAITSSARSEGKSTNSINLALSYAELGKKVLLIDCDLRLPTVASKLKIQSSKKKGLSNILAEGVSISEAVHVMENNGPHVITAGTIPPDPTRLLQSERMRALLVELRENYDYIILDCPPVNAVIDALLLVTIVDGYILVMRHEQTDHRDVVSMLGKLRHAKANVLGVIYTDVPAEGNKYYRNKYYQ